MVSILSYDRIYLYTSVENVFCLFIFVDLGKLTVQVKRMQFAVRCAYSRVSLTDLLAFFLFLLEHFNNIKALFSSFEFLKLVPNFLNGFFNCTFSNKRVLVLCLILINFCLAELL